MNNFIAEIKNYILFLKKQCQLEITLHPNGNEQLISESELIYFNIHENSHCIYVKTFPKAHEHCINRQYKINEKCSEVFDKEILDFLQQIFNIFKFIAPLLCLALSMMDFVKAVAGQDKDALSKATKTTGKRIIYAIVLFFIPDLINFLFEFDLTFDLNIASAVVALPLKKSNTTASLLVHVAASINSVISSTGFG